MSEGDCHHTESRGYTAIFQGLCTRSPAVENVIRLLKNASMEQTLSASSGSNEESSGDIIGEEDCEMSSPSGTPVGIYVDDAHEPPPFPIGDYGQLYDGLVRNPQWTIYSKSLASCLKAAAQIAKDPGR